MSTPFQLTMETDGTRLVLRLRADSRARRARVIAFLVLPALILLPALYFDPSAGFWSYVIGPTFLLIIARAPLSWRAEVRIVDGVAHLKLSPETVSVVCWAKPIPLDSIVELSAPWYTLRSALARGVVK